MQHGKVFIVLLVSLSAALLSACSETSTLGDAAPDDDGESPEAPDTAHDPGPDDLDAPDTAETDVGGDPGEPDEASTLGKLGEEILLYEGRNPHIASDSHGHPHIVFDRLREGVYYSMGSGASGEFPADPVRIGPAGAIEPQIFIDENDSAHVVWAHSPAGSNVGGTQGWYTNNVGGSWRDPVLVAEIGDGDTGDGGLERITCGRVVKIPDLDLAVTSWSGQHPKTLLVGIDGLSSAPGVVKKVRAELVIPGLVALPSSVRTVYRTPGGERAGDYDLDLNALTPTVLLIDVAMSGECGDGFLEPGTGVVHYTGTAAGDSSSTVWYTNDDRIEHGMEALTGMVAAELGATGWYWADVCVDVLGQAYVTHSYIDTDGGVCTADRCNSYVTYVENEELKSVPLAPGYSGFRVGPYCSPAPSGGIHVTYHLKDPDRVFYRTVDAR